MRQRFLRSFPTLAHYMEQVAVHLPCICPASPLHLPTSPSHRSPTRGHHITAQIKATARRQGKAFTVGGRMRPLPHIASTNRDEQAKAERQVANATANPTCISPVSALSLPISPLHLPYISLYISVSPHASPASPHTSQHTPGGQLDHPGLGGGRDEGRHAHLNPNPNPHPTPIPTPTPAPTVVQDAMLRCRDELHRRRLPALLLAQARLGVGGRVRLRVRVRVRFRVRRYG